MKKLLLTLAVVGMCFGMVGCATLQNLNIEDVRTDDNFRKDGYIHMSISRIDYCLKQYNYKCSQVVIPNINPEKNKEANIVMYGMGLTQENPYLIIDLNEIEENNTYYRAYTEYPTWNRIVDDIINKTIDCGQCKYK